MCFSALFAAALLVVVGAPAAGSAVDRRPGIAANASTACQNVDVAPAHGNGGAVDDATMCLMNQVRVAHHLRPLHANRALSRVATGQARDMVRGRYFADQSLSGQSPLTRIMASNYPVRVASVHLLTAQNIGWGTGPNATPAGIVRAWMQSPPHRRIILTGAYRDAGVGVALNIPSGVSGGLFGATYAVEFGARRF
jgi:uncharacterized protein YkwD